MHKTPIECDFRGSHKWNGIPVPSTTINSTRNTSLDEREFIQHCVTANTSSNQITSSHWPSTLNKNIYTRAGELKKRFERANTAYIAWPNVRARNRIWANAKRTKSRDSGPWPLLVLFLWNVRRDGGRRWELEWRENKEIRWKWIYMGNIWMLYYARNAFSSMRPRCNRMCSKYFI